MYHLSEWTIFAILAVISDHLALLERDSRINDIFIHKLDMKKHDDIHEYLLHIKRTFSHKLLTILFCLVTASEDYDWWIMLRIWCVVITCNSINICEAGRGWSDEVLGHHSAAVAQSSVDIRTSRIHQIFQSTIQHQTNQDLF